MTYTPKTKVTDVDVDDFLKTVDEKRRLEAYKIIDMMSRVSGESPKMWGPTMIGFGKYHYVSKSKIEADWFKIGFSPRKAKISFYISMDADEFSEANLSDIYENGYLYISLSKEDTKFDKPMTEKDLKAYFEENPYTLYYVK